MNTTSLILFVLSLTPASDMPSSEPAESSVQPAEARRELESQSLSGIPEQGADLELWGDNPSLLERVSRIA